MEITSNCKSFLKRNFDFIWIEKSSKTLYKPLHYFQLTISWQGKHHILWIERTCKTLNNPLLVSSIKVEEKKLLTHFFSLIALTISWIGRTCRTLYSPLVCKSKQCANKTLYNPLFCKYQQCAKQRSSLHNFLVCLLWGVSSTPFGFPFRLPVRVANWTRTQLTSSKSCWTDHFKLFW